MRKIAVLLGCLGLLWCAVTVDRSPVEISAATENAPLDRSPVDLVLGPDESWLVVIDQTADLAVLIETQSGKVLDEARVGRRPVAVAATDDGKRMLVTSGHAGEVSVFEVEDGRLNLLATLAPGFEPHGVALAPDGRTAYVSLAAAHQVAIVDLEKLEIAGRFDVGRWPRHVAVSRDGARLAVAVSGEGGVDLVDLADHTLLHRHKFRCMNPGLLHAAADGNVYFPWMFYGSSSTSAGNIQRGWVMGSRLGRIGLDEPEVRRGLSLDPRGRAIADPYGVEISGDGRRVVISASGSHELLVLAHDELPWVGISGSDHMDRRLAADADRFQRIELGGRPLGLKIAADDRTVYVANYLSGEIQVVDLDEGRLVRAISLKPSAKAELSLARRGEAIFYDGKRSLEGWYSCHSCHQEGGGNIELIDTFNDGSAGTYKTVLPLYYVDQTGPWTWHGWQDDLHESMRSSMLTTMRGPEPTAEDVAAIIAFCKTLELPPNPHRQADGSLTAAAERGRAVFHSDRAGCANCHHGPLYTDGEIHDVGLNHRDDRYQGYNTPPLVGVYRKVRLLHNGKAQSLEELLTGLHDPAKVTGQGELSREELADLVEFLKSL